MTEMREKIREASVEIVDRLRAYGVTFAPDPVAHRKDYDFVETVINRALLSQSSPSGGSETPSNQSLQEGMVLWPEYPTWAMLKRLYDICGDGDNFGRCSFSGDSGNWAWLLGELRHAASPSSISQEQEKGKPSPSNAGKVASCELRIQGKPYPRTCPVCGLGPCRTGQT